MRDSWTPALRTAWDRAKGILAVVPLVTALVIGPVGPAWADGGQPHSRTAAPLPGFRNGDVVNDGIRIHYVVGGHGPAVVLLHGWPETWLAWSKVMPALARSHTVVAIDLRGMGESGAARHDEGSYLAPVVATDVRAVAVKLHLGAIDLAGHDWGGAVALSYAAQYRDGVRRLAVLEAPPTTDYLNLVSAKPGTLWWDWFINGPQGLLAETLVAGRERSFYGGIYQSAGRAISAATADRYIAAYSRPGHTHAGFEYFRQQDAGERQVDRLIHDTGKITVPVLGMGGEKSMGALIGADLPRVATNVTGVVVPGVGHWLPEEDPGFISARLGAFFSEPAAPGR
ncbi:MAG TPA: alpha/beta hydrolase [Pseudonocardia sp.]